jgi:hypothetical protein
MLIAGALLAALILIALAFPFIWHAATGQPLQGSLGRLVNGSAAANGGPIYPYGAPGQSVMTITEVTWPTDKSILGKWNNRTPGQGTIYGYYYTNITGQGYTWSDGLSFPIPSGIPGSESTSSRVIIAEWPRGDDPAKPREMHVCLGRLVKQPNGDAMPQAEGWYAGCILNAAQAKWAAEHGLPDDFLAAIVAETDKSVQTGQMYNPASATRIDPAKYIPPPEEAK